MILDTGCPKNVAGKVCDNFFIDSLNIDLVEKVKNIREKAFKFGGGCIITSLQNIEIPILLADETVIIDVLDSDLPLLFGK